MFAQRVKVSRALGATVLAFAVLGPVSGCTDSVSNPKPTTTGGGDVASFQGTLVSDNSSVGAIINHLEWENGIENFALSTAETPYGITINQGDGYCEGGVCRMVDANADSNRTNAATMLALIANADWVEIHTPVHPCPQSVYVEEENQEPNCVFEYRFERAELADQIALIRNSWGS